MLLLRGSDAREVPRVLPAALLDMPDGDEVHGSEAARQAPEHCRGWRVECGAGRSGVEAAMGNEADRERFKAGTRVVTLRPTAKDYTAEAQACRRWGVHGKVVGVHDSHGLCFDVRHDDGTRGTYDPDELASEEVVAVASGMLHSEWAALVDQAEEMLAVVDAAVGCTFRLSEGVLARVRRAHGGAELVVDLGANSVGRAAGFPVHDWNMSVEEVDSDTLVALVRLRAVLARWKAGEGPFPLQDDVLVRNLA